MKHLFYIAIVLVAFSACTQAPTAEEEAARAAQSYYQLLQDNQLDMFIQGKAGIDSLPSGYRMQMLKVYEQYLNEIKEKHNGINEVGISENVGRYDPSKQFVYAFLMVSFGDSTQEEITVPMVENNGKWIMK